MNFTISSYFSAEAFIDDYCMAHSLSPPPFHSYQCSPSAESHGYSGNSSNHRQHHRNDIATKEKNHHGANQIRPRLMSLKGKSWSSFLEAIGTESSKLIIYLNLSITFIRHHLQIR